MVLQVLDLNVDRDINSLQNCYLISNDLVAEQLIVMVQMVISILGTDYRSCN